MDLIDKILKDWQKQRPDIDCSSKEITARMFFCSSRIHMGLEKALKPFKITPTVFSVLVTIRRRGKTAEITVRQIMEEILITSGATSNLINKLVANQIITKRYANENEDARSVFVKLTPFGLALIDKAMVSVAECEHRVTQMFTPKQKQELTKLLRQFSQEI